jgi:hypothetical protein
MTLSELKWAMSVNYEALHFRPLYVMNAVICSELAVRGMWVQVSADKARKE